MTNKIQFLTCIITNILYLCTIATALIGLHQGLFTKGESIIIALIIISTCWIVTKLSTKKDIKNK